jgi:hypothetical protein
MICERQDSPLTVDPQTTMRPTFQKNEAVPLDAAPPHNHQRSPLDE